MENFSYQDISKQISYDAAEAFEVKLSKVEAIEKEKVQRELTTISQL